jgi:geranylgeranyl reductase family protein
MERRNDFSMRYDVAIVGAGPAGSTAAKILSEKGIRTLLLEKTTFPRDKPCGGGLQMQILRRFKYIQDHDLVDSYSSAIQLHSSSMKHHITFHNNRPLQAMVRRKTFDQGLATIATQSGAVLNCGDAVKTITNENDHIRIALSNGTAIESKMVIGADGTWSTIAQNVGMKQDCSHIGVCAYNEYQMSQHTIHRLYGDQRQVHIYLRPHGLAGYGWVFPKKEHVNIGVVEFRHAINPVTEKKNLQTQYACYLQMLKQQKILPKNLAKATPIGGVFPTCPMRTFTADRVLLCGDAAGLVNPMTGEGIYYAMYSGELAAKTAIKALENNTTDARSLREYHRRWNHEFHLDFSLLSRLSKRWARNIDNIIMFASKDKKLIDLICHAIPNPGGIQKERLRILRRFILTYCKGRLQQ